MSAAPNSSVRVLVRCRPILPGESDHANTRVQLFANEGKVVLQGKPYEDARCFTFDRVFSPDTRQEDIMDEIAPLIDHVLNGLHATVFAYGQTGSGKTYTVEGIDYVKNNNNILVPNTKADTDSHGIILRSIQLIFDKARVMQKSDNHVRFRLRCSYYQLYNERITDLLNPSSTRNVDGFQDGGLKIGWSRGDVFHVENLFLYDCDEPKKMRRVYLSGAREKIMESHAMNYQSSRSHTVFTVHVERSDPDTPECTVKSEFTVVDLAGSEKLLMLSKNPSNTLIRESIEINASLLALGKVINALADVANKKVRAGETVPQTHIPYRDSKLTKLLKHALGGNSLTTMIACISPSDRYVEETLSTLLYAGRARNIKNVPHINEDPKSALIRQLRKDIVNLTKELSYYRTIAGKTLGSTGRDLHIQKEEMSGSQSSYREGPIGRLTSKSEETRDKKQINELAEKLIQACDFLKNIITVNGQLRDAFDSIKESKTELEQREVELNAENIALRERIEMLESIALDDNFSVSPSNRTSNQQGQHKKKHQSSIGALLTMPLTASRTASSSGREKPNQSFRLSSGKDSSGYSDLSFQRLLYPSPRLTKTRSASVTTGLKEAQSKQQSVLEKRLVDYTKRYCQPNRDLSYAEYYGRARQQLPNNPVANEVIASMDKTIKQLPQDVANTIIPQSLRLASHFGALSFAGESSDVAVLEEKRRQREEKRNALLAQQQMLHTNLSRVLAGATGELRQASIRVAQLKYESPPSYSESVPLRHSTIALSEPMVPQATGSSASRLRRYIEREEAKIKATAASRANSQLRGQRESGSRSGNGMY